MKQIVRHLLLTASAVIVNFCPSLSNAETLYVPEEYPTIQEAIDTFKGSNALYTEIRIAPGTYIENIQLEQTSASANVQARNYDLDENVPNNTSLRGLQIIGDNRPCFPQYQNGYQNAANSAKSTVYTLETDIPEFETFPVLVAQFGLQPSTDTGPLPAQVCDPFIANPLPLENDFAGGFAIIGRGEVGFATKTKRAQDAGAGAVIIIDNSPIGTVLMGGTDPSITIPSFSISAERGELLLKVLEEVPDLQLTIKPPATFYSPPIGSNYAHVSLSHPEGDTSRIQVTVSGPLPEVDPNLPRGTAPVLEQPVFDSPDLDFHPGDKIYLAESDIFGNYARGYFEIESLDGNIITLTDSVTGIDIEKPGTSLTFLPNVLLLPEEGRFPVFRAQEIGFSLNGLWIDTNPRVPFAQTTTGLLLSGCEAYLSNVIVSDTNYTSANGPGISIDNGSSVSIADGWRNASDNRRLSVLGWSRGVNVSNASKLTGNFVFTTALTNQSAFNLSNNSRASLDSLILIGNYGLYQPDTVQLNVAGESSLTVGSLLTVADVFGSGILANDSNIYCSSFTLERTYKPAGGQVAANALQLIGNSKFTVAPDALYEDGQPVASINTTSFVSDCFDIDPDGEITGNGTVPNVGIFVDYEARFESYKDLEFSNNSVDYLTLEDDQFITPGWQNTPGSVFQIAESGPLNPSYQLQSLVGGKVRVTLDPSREFQLNGLYISSNTVGKTFTIFSQNPSEHTIVLERGSFVGSKSNTLKFSRKEGSFVTLKILSSTEVLVLDSKGVFFLGEEHDCYNDICDNLCEHRS